MEEALRSRFLADGAVAALVGTRVTWIDRPQGSGLPAVTLQKITPGRDYTYGGASGSSSPMVQADCWGGTYAEAKALERAVIAMAERRAVVGGVKFAPSFVEAARDMAPEDLPGGGKAYRVSIDLIVWNNPA